MIFVYFLRIRQSRLQTTDYRLQTTYYILQTTYYILQTADYRLQTADYRLQTADQLSVHVVEVCVCTEGILMDCVMCKDLVYVMAV